MVVDALAVVISTVSESPEIDDLLVETHALQKLNVNECASVESSLVGDENSRKSYMDLSCRTGLVTWS